MLQIFIVFHKYIFDECYENIPQDILDKYFTFVAVNPQIIKEYTLNKYKVINEWELPVYDKFFQEKGYNENSAIYHIYINNLHKNYKNIGFFQYDMKFNNLNNINQIDKIIENMNNNTYYCISQDTFDECCYGKWIDDKVIFRSIDDYEKYFKIKFSKNEKYPLFNSYIISKIAYIKIMKWIIQTYDTVYSSSGLFRDNAGHMGGLYERLMAFAIGQEKLTPILMDISHDTDYKTKAY